MEETKNMTLEEKIEHYELLLREKDVLQQLQTKDGELSRARSYYVGSTVGGLTEITLRGHDSKILFYILQPVEVSELIHTLAASIGCYAALKPRQDFTSWRNWKVSDEERKLLFNDPDKEEKELIAHAHGSIGLQNNDNGKKINTLEQPGLQVEED